MEEPFGYNFGVQKTMPTIEETFGKNLADFRKAKHLTQLELAEKLGYSDKSISKWEGGKGLPPLDVAKELAAFFEVKVDDFLAEEGARKIIDNAPNGSARRANQISIMAMVVCSIFFLAAVVYVYSNSFADTPLPDIWTVFVWAVPISALVLSLMSVRFYKFTTPFWILLSIAVWTAFIAIPLQIQVSTGENIWYVLFVPIPLQVGILLGMRLK